MKFRGRLVRASGLEDVVRCCERVSDSALLVMSPECWSFRLGDDESVAMGAAACTFAHVQTRHTFEHYRISSRSGNVIALQLSVPLLAKALKSCQKASKITVVLTRKGEPADSFLSFLISHNGEHLNLVQDVPVSVQSARKIEESEEPKLPPPAAKFRLPDLKPFRAFVEKMKIFTNFAKIKYFAEAGQLQLEAQTDMVTTRALYVDLALNLPEGANMREEQAQEVECLVDFKKLSRALVCSALNPMASVCCIIPQHCLLLHFEIEEDFGNITYYIPLLAE